MTGANNREIVERCISLKLPAIHTFPFEAKSGALISYGIDIEENYLRIAEYADHLLKGAKIADRAGPGNLHRTISGISA
jgi:ABC-type uncharacterized transport system substrate-binding protein